MGSFFIEFRDPLFSIIVLFAIIFVLSFFSYWWGRYKAKDNYKYLDRFVEQFHALPGENELKQLIQSTKLSYKSWLLLAQAYTKNGDYEKAIEIYSELLMLQETKKHSRDIMFLLGKTYFKAGFLGRSRDVFLEIVRKNPRTPQALHYLLLVYEYMRDYNSALEVLEPLDELNEDISKEALYLKVLALLQAPDIDESLRKDELVFFYREHKTLHRMIFEYLFRVDAKKAWEEFELSKAPFLADIFWSLPKESIDFEKVEKSPFLRELYSAKGYIQSAKKSTVFELNLLLHVDKEVGVGLNFEYMCSACKMVFPFGFSRCSNCHSIDTVTLEYNLIKTFNGAGNETSNSFL